MKNKTGFILGGGVLVVLIILYFVFEKKMKANQNLSSGKVTDDKALAEAIERIYILETANYTSNIFKKTNGAGILAFGTDYPFGWNMLEKFWTDNPTMEPSDFYFSPNGLTYLVFPTVLAGQKAVGEIVKYRVGRGESIGAYFSLIESEQQAYLKKLLGITIPEEDIVRPNKYLV
jgi:hypothetical protein